MNLNDFYKHKVEINPGSENKISIKTAKIPFDEADTYEHPRDPDIEKRVVS